MKSSVAMALAYGLCALIAVTAASAEHTSAVRDRIVPALDPVDEEAPHDQTFMKKDYPDDRRAKVFHKFDYPYPTVQDSEDYDKDYVEDKSDDGGYWLAQMKYDELKNILQKEQDQMKKALRDLKKEQE